MNHEVSFKMIFRLQKLFYTDVKQAIDELECDDHMKIKEKTCGAIWHIFRAEDSDKIREFIKNDVRMK